MTVFLANMAMRVQRSRAHLASGAIRGGHSLSALKVEMAQQRGGLAHSSREPFWTGVSLPRTWVTGHDVRREAPLAGQSTD